ncbi:MAG: hypothetical protein O3B87_01725 [bacterium]|nr:hypothetical protein [bacterium]
MHNLPRLIVAIPIAILVLGVYVKMAFPNQLRMLTSSQSDNLISSESASEYSQQESIPAPHTSDPVSFDIVKPRTCEYKSDGINAQVFVQNNKVSATITQEGEVKRIMLLDDCAHIWQEGEFTGQQICGVSQYLELFQTYSSFLSPDMLIGMIPGLDEGTEIGSGDILSRVLNSCVDGAVDESKFILPKNINFEKTSPEQAQEVMEKNP